MNHAVTSVALRSDLSRFYSNIFTVMAIGLTITGITSLWLSSNAGMMEHLFGLYQYVEDGKSKTGMTASGWWYAAAAFELILVIALTWGSLGKRRSIGSLVIMFGVYSALNGITLAPMIFSYTSASVAKTFFITAGTFGACSFFGHTTKINLRPMGTFFLVGLIGLLMALIVNMLLASPAMDFVISAAAVLLFAGLTAYDMQTLQEMYDENDGDAVAKLVVFGALTLYLDFINLFIYLLRFIGVRKD